jgi:hypothetical protein
LLSGKTVLQVQGRGAHLRLQHCLVVAAGDALRFDVGAKAGPRLDVQCLLERSTIAVRGSVLRIAGVPKLSGAIEPIAIQAESSVFVDPFIETPRRSALLRCEGDVVSRGLVLWRGKGNGYDEKRLHAYVAAGPNAERQSHTAWARLWGKPGEQQAVLLDWSQVPQAMFPVDRPQLDGLRVPQALGSPIGADFVRLRIVGKK